MFFSLFPCFIVWFFMFMFGFICTVVLIIALTTHCCFVVFHYLCSSSSPLLFIVTLLFLVAFVLFIVILLFVIVVDTHHHLVVCHYHIAWPSINIAFACHSIVVHHHLVTCLTSPLFVVMVLPSCLQYVSCVVGTLWRLQQKQLAF